MNVVWLNRARLSAANAAEYIAHEHPAAADRLLTILRVSAEQLADYPHLGRPGRVNGTRELVVTGVPYILAYRVKKDEVQILHVLHMAQDWPEKF